MVAVATFFSCYIHIQCHLPRFIHALHVVRSTTLYIANNFGDYITVGKHPTSNRAFYFLPTFFLLLAMVTHSSTPAGDGLPD
jgi:hypothetical protein